MASVDLAVIGNGLFGALLDAEGRYVWCCMGGFDSEPVFNSLANNNSTNTGFYDTALEGFEFSEQAYLGTSPILVTTLHTSQGDSVEIRDFVPRFYQYERTFRPFQLVRTVQRVRGDPQIRVRIRPTFQYNSTSGYQTRGSQHIRFCGPNQTWRVTTNVSIRYILEEKPFLVPSEPVHIIFGTDESFTNSLTNVAKEFERMTHAFWVDWCNMLALPVEFQDVLARAAMTLSILQSEDCGGFVASLTMGIPLGPCCLPTRDTRVCRLLDECLALPVLREVGLLNVSRKYLMFLKELCFREEWPQHTVTTLGTAECRERQWAQYLAGYRGLGEVYSGGDLLEPGAAAAPGPDPGAPPDMRQWSQHVMVCGLLVVALAHAFFDMRLSAEICTQKLFERLECFALHACDGFQRALELYCAAGAGRSASQGAAGARPPCGAGFFDDDAAFHAFVADPAAAQGAPACEPGRAVPVHSLAAVLCWAAADRLDRVAQRFLGDARRAGYWRQRAAAMHSAICLHAWSAARGAFTTYWGGARVGPSLLRLAELGFVSAGDGRFSSTVRAFEMDALDHAVSISSADGAPLTQGLLAGGEGAGGAARVGAAVALGSGSICFTTSTLLWYCEALRCTGRASEGRRLLESLLCCSAHRGLLSESVDLKAAEPWGNAPSTAALLSLLRVASRLSRSWREV